MCAQIPPCGWLLGKFGYQGFCAALCVCVNSRLSFGCVFGYGNGEGSVCELWWPGSSHHRDDSRGAAAAQLVSSHHRQQILPVSLQGKACSSYLATLPVHFETSVTTCKYKQNVFFHNTQLTEEHKSIKTKKTRTWINTEKTSMRCLIIAVDVIQPDISRILVSMILIKIMHSKI